MHVNPLGAKFHLIGPKSKQPAQYSSAPTLNNVAQRCVHEGRPDCNCWMQVVLTTIEPSKHRPELSYDAYEYTVCCCSSFT